MGPISQHFLQTAIYQGSDPFDFVTRNAGVKISTRIRGKDSNQTLNLSYQGSYNFVTDYNNEIFETAATHKNWINMVFAVNYRSRIWGVYGSYYNGPYSINQQYSYFAYNYYSKNIRIFPYVDVTVLPKYLYLSSKLNYTYDISGKTNRVNFINEFYGYPIKNLKLSFLATMNYQANKDLLTEEKFSYSSTYFEVRLKKEFDFDQPRYQYHNLKVLFFKDLNGNSVKDEDEPGIQNVLFSIKMDEKQVVEIADEGKNYFMATELLSDQFGVVAYDNIPGGFYIIDYLPVSSSKDAFTSTDKQQAIYMGKNETLYIPFFENNKIFGRALLNRSKLSNLGSIDVSNIKVTAEDSYGKKYSALTDAAGNFSIYVPSVDKYKVNINNIFFENFELEQNNYEVQLNGYRQFEVNFIFNEKKRKINFAADYDYGSRLDRPGVEIVRRTNLSGTIKDATTLQPIVAKVRVVDGQGREITSANSSTKTGIFTLSFVAGDDYTVEVNADEYWFYAEKLYSQQIVTFSNLKKEILLKAITVGALIPMNTLNFNDGSFEILPTTFPELERLMKVLKKNPSVQIDVHGHADDMEIQDAQTDLALERAKMVAKYLIANGYNRVKYSGHANTKPIADNETVEGRKVNRRVEIVVTGK
jgi:outer membrane protein OmpA-like peptidoglycan-associated protein